jgi:DNA repair protein RecO (recombination protein O)
MGLFSSEGVVIRTRPYRERDKFITLFTPDRGKINVRAAGALTPGSRFGSALELGATLGFDAFQHTAESLPQLSAGRARRVILRPRSDLRAFAHLSLLLELVAELATGSEPAPVYEALQRELVRLERDGAVTAALLAFALRLLCHIGHEPEVQVCVKCREPLTVAGFAPDAGGVIGRCCRPSQPLLAPATLAALREKPVDETAAYAALALLEPFVRRHLEHELRAWDFYRRQFAAAA